MKKFFMFLAVAGIMAVSANYASAQEQAADAAEPATEAVAPAANDLSALTANAPEVPLHQQLKTKFIEGGPLWMAPIALVLVLGLALSIERILYLTFAKTNTKKLLKGVEDALANGGIEAAKDLCRNTRGPVASIFYQGLLRYEEGVDVVEKTIVSYGSVQMSLMEDGMTWISLFIALAPSLGFLGTVVGMIAAFDAIQAAGDSSPNVVAGGMKVALITTVFGLIVAMILQVFFNYILTKIESLTTDMEDSSISFVDVMTKFAAKSK